SVTKEKSNMPGTPIKRARREAEAQAREAAGMVPWAAPAPPVARAREASGVPRAHPPRAPPPPLPSAPELAELATRVLLDIAVNGGGPDAGARVGAARALVERAEESVRRETEKTE